MKYFVVAIVIILVAALIWILFFSGFFIKKLTPNNNLASDGSAVIVNVVLETNFGTIRLALDRGTAPKTVANFEKLVRENFYNSLTFHRIIPGFVIQGGDPKGDGTGGPGYTIPAEIKLPHKRGAIAMARLPDAANPNRESSGSQFYIALQDLPGLDGQYTVFGKVVEGMEIVDRIAQVKTDANDFPPEKVIIKKAFIVE